MLQQYKQFAAMIKTMGGKNGLFNKMGDMKQNPNPKALMAMQQQMSKMLPPQMMQQMGGMAGIQNMMKQFGSNPDMAKMMGDMGKMFGGMGAPGGKK